MNVDKSITITCKWTLTRNLNTNLFWYEFCSIPTPPKPSSLCRGSFDIILINKIMIQKRNFKQWPLIFETFDPNCAKDTVSSCFLVARRRSSARGCRRLEADVSGATQEVPCGNSHWSQIINY